MYSRGTNAKNVMPLGEKTAQLWKEGKCRGMTGRKHSNLSKQKMSTSKKGTQVFEKNPSWKGDKVSKRGIHTWLKKSIGVPDHCDLCGSTEQPENTLRRKTPRKRNYFEWSCRTRVYARDLHNWWQLCALCHRNYDKDFLRE